MSKPSFRKPASLKTAFEPDAWERFEDLAKAAAKTRHVPPTETAPKRKTGLRSTPLKRKTPLRSKTPLTRRPK